MPTTLSALSLPFDEAIAYLADKTNATSTHWTDVWQQANAKAFTVAGAATKALVKDFRTEVAKALEQGTTLAEFRKSFDQIVKKHGWKHTGTPGWRARIIYETNLSMAYSAGRYAQATAPETLAAFPYWQYVHSGALHPRLQHLSWNGLVLRADDPWWSTHYPPNGWRCGCRVRVLSARDLSRQGKSGPDQAPPVEHYTWINPKTGEAKQATKGIDPGFDYNPGQVWRATPVSLPPNATLTVPPLRPLPGEGAGRSAAGGGEPAREWPWEPIPPRAIERLAMDADALAQGRSLGLFRTKAEARSFAGRLMAGVPDEEKLTVQITGGGGYLRVEGFNPGLDERSMSTRVARTFSAPRGRLTVAHDLFTLHRSYQGGGHAARMMRSSIEAYRQAGVAEVKVHANIDVGGYAWARLGFQPEGPEGLARLRAYLSQRFERLPAADKELLLRIVREAPDDALMYRIATARNPEGRAIGKPALKWSDWFGRIDLANPAHLRLLRKALE